MGRIATKEAQMNVRSIWHCRKLDSKRRWLARARLGKLIPRWAIAEMRDGRTFVNRLESLGCVYRVATGGMQKPSDGDRV
jgi:hypothetical protein